MSGEASVASVPITPPAAGTSGVLHGELALPEGANTVVVFAHGTGSSRHSPRNQAVARMLGDAHLGTLLLDLLTEPETEEDARTAEPRFDIDLLARRVTAVVDWLGEREDTGSSAVGLFGASTGAAAALHTAAQRPETVRAVVSRGGRPDLARQALAEVRAPVLLLVGGRDEEVLELNERAAKSLRSCELDVVPGATHLFEERGALEQVGQRAAQWFGRHLS